VGLERGNDPSDLDVEALASEIEARAQAACPDEPAAIRVLLAGLRPPRWTLEWYLPWWLGESLGVAAHVSRELVISNVLGLAALRLRDDAVDGESTLAPARAEAIGSALLARAIDSYRALFEPSSPVWDELRRSMGEWRDATAEAAPRAPASAGNEAPTTSAIARRGAPLRICVSAACQLAARPELEAALHLAVDHALAAWILADDADDWADDADARRANAFVRALVPDPTASMSAAELADEVQIAMLTTDRLEDYFDRIGREADRAAAIADAVIGLSAFSRHVRAYGERHRTRGARMQADYHAITDCATRLIFGRALD
jgi:hypothetical protein